MKMCEIKLMIRKSFLESLTEKKVVFTLKDAAKMVVSAHYLLFDKGRKDSLQFDL